MSPSKLNNIDELNYLIKLQDIEYFKAFIVANRISYRVAMFKAIESGLVELTDIVRWHHPHPEGEDMTLECQHAAFRGFLCIYQTIPLNEEMEEFNAFRENMYLYHGRLEKVNIQEISMHDLLSPNTIPVSVCDVLISSYPQNACLVTGVLLAYCIHNSNHFTQLQFNPHIFVMDLMFQYAAQHNNKRLTFFLMETYNTLRQYTEYDYRLRRDCFSKKKRFNGNSDKYAHYSFTAPGNRPLLLCLLKKPLGDAKYTVDKRNLCLSADMFEWQSSNMATIQVDAYFEQVLDTVNLLIDQGIELEQT